mmetsp:Transcript_13508/g.37036  ORF Transcript_13508/g.37036 Transcript_13508/m.37036 type:complete len:336 (-) Transcript_13508:66-1073(-)
MLGVACFRTATIQATTILFCWELMHKDALAIFERHPDVCQHFGRTICKNLETSVPQRILALPLFHQFDRHFLTILVLKGRSRAYFAKQMILQEGRSSKSLYILNRGSALLERRGVEIQTYAAGSHLNCMAMLGSTRPLHCSLTAVQTCHMISIPRRAFLTAFQMHPSPSAEAELRKSEEAAEKALHLLVWRLVTRARMRGGLGPPAEGFSAATGVFRVWHCASDGAILRRCLAAWSRHARLRSRCRRERAALVLEVSRFALRSERARESRAPALDLEDRWPLVARERPPPLRRKGFAPDHGLLELAISQRRAPCSASARGEGAGAVCCAALPHNA